MDVKSALEQSKLAATQGDTVKARAILRKVVEQEPSNVAAWLLFSKVAEKREHVIQCLEQALKIDPNNRVVQQELFKIRLPKPAFQKSIFYWLNRIILHETDDKMIRESTLSLEEVAREIHLNEEAVIQLIKDGKLQAFCLGDEIRIPKKPQFQEFTQHYAVSISEWKTDAEAKLKREAEEKEKREIEKKLREQEQKLIEQKRKAQQTSIQLQNRFGRFFVRCDLDRGIDICLETLAQGLKTNPQDGLAYYERGLLLCAKLFGVGWLEPSNYQHRSEEEFLRGMELYPPMVASIEKGKSIDEVKKGLRMVSDATEAFLKATSVGIGNPLDLAVANFYYALIVKLEGPKVGDDGKIYVPNDYRAKCELSEVAAETGIKHLKRHLRLSPNDLDALLYLSALQQELGKFSDAKETRFRIQQSQALQQLGSSENIAPKENLNEITLPRVSGIPFEQLCLKLITAMGFKATTTTVTGDGGIDIIAINSQPLVAGKYIIQCKDWQASVGEPPVRDLYGVVTAERANKGILICSSTFTKAALLFAEGKPLELVDKEQLDILLKKHGVER